jgi:hypothetical protein
VGRNTTRYQAISRTSAVTSGYRSPSRPPSSSTASQATGSPQTSFKTCMEPSLTPHAWASPIGAGRLRATANAATGALTARARRSVASRRSRATAISGRAAVSVAGHLRRADLRNRLDLGRNSASCGLSRTSASMKSRLSYRSSNASVTCRRPRASDRSSGSTVFRPRRPQRSLRAIHVRALANYLHAPRGFGDDADALVTSRESAWFRAALTACMPPSVSVATRSLLRKSRMDGAPSKKRLSRTRRSRRSKGGRERRTAATRSTRVARSRRAKP